jgi:predicted transposase YdaD
MAGSYLELNPTEAAELAALQTREGDQEASAMTMTWADRMEEKGRQEGIRTGREEGRQEGRQEGRREALRDVLLLQLGRRFGPLPAGIRQRVEAIASMERLTRLSEQILIARSLDEMELS